MPKVSVLVPIYNVEKYLRECLDSIATQTLADIEIICINDGSTDGSLSIINEFAQRDVRFRVIDKPNGGYGAALNRGLELASSEYVGIIDSDDVILPGMFETLYYNARLHSLDFIRSDYYHWMPTAKPEVRRYCTSLKSKYYNVVYCPIKTPQHIYNAVLTCSGLYRLNFLKENAIRYRETPGAAFQDQGFWFQVTVLAKRAMYINESFYLYRYDNPSSSINAGRNQKGSKSVQPNRQVQLMTSEYDYLFQNFVSKHLSNKDLLAFYWKARYYNCLFALDRAGANLTPQDCSLFLTPFQRAKEDNQLDTSFFTEEMLTTLEKDPKTLCSYREKQVHKLYRKQDVGVWGRLYYKIQDEGIIACGKKIGPRIKRMLYAVVGRFKKKIKAYAAKLGNPLVESLKSALYLSDQKSELMFWLSQNREEESMTETKRRVFLGMPKAEGSLRERQLEYIAVLEELKRVLDENHITFWPMGGTMIGMVRHHGFIPWDDDIDISMMYEDKEKLFEAINKSESLRIEEVYWLSNKMLRCPRVQFKDYGRKGLVDIFLWERSNYESRNDSALWRKRNAAVSEMNTAYQRIKNKLHGKYNGTVIRDVHDRALIEGLFEHYRAECLKACGGTGTTIFGSVDMWFEDGRWCAVYQKGDIVPMQEVPFENTVYLVPNSSEKMLRDQYGDWLSLPQKVTPNHGG